MTPAEPSTTTVTRTPTGTRTVSHDLARDGTPAPVVGSTVEPVDLADPALRRRLRRAVVEHHRRGDLRPVVHVGEPGGSTLRLVLDDLGHEDPGLRVDLVSRLVARLVSGSGSRPASAAASGSGSEQETEQPAPWPLVWLTREGDLACEDLDVQWQGATAQAAAELGRPLLLVVVTREGWREPRSGVERRWVRLRLTDGR